MSGSFFRFDQQLSLLERKEQVASSSWMASERLLACERIVAYLTGGSDSDEGVVAKRLTFMLQRNSELACEFAAFFAALPSGDNSNRLRISMRNLTSRLLDFLRAVHPHTDDNFSIDSVFVNSMTLLMNNVVVAVLTDACCRDTDLTDLTNHTNHANLANLANLTNLADALSIFCKTVLPFTHCSVEQLTAKQALALALASPPYGFDAASLKKMPIVPPALRFILTHLQTELEEECGIDVDTILAPRSPPSLDRTPPRADDKLIFVPPKRRRLEIGFADKPESIPASPRLRF